MLVCYPRCAVDVVARWKKAGCAEGSCEVQSKRSSRDPAETRSIARHRLAAFGRRVIELISSLRVAYACLSVELANYQARRQRKERLVMLYMWAGLCSCARPDKT